MMNVYAEIGSNFQQVGGDCPAGWIGMQGDRPSPEHVAQEDGSWALLPLSSSAVAARRWEAETSGITVAGMQVDTDDRGKLLINGAVVEAMLDPEYTLRWKTADGFVELTSPQVIGVARAVRAHVQACFDRESELIAELEAGTFTEDMLEQGWP